MNISPRCTPLAPDSRVATRRNRARYSSSPRLALGHDRRTSLTEIFTRNGYSFVESGIFKKLQASERWILPYKLKKRIRNEGKEEGLKEGEKKVREKAIEMAQAMKQKGMDIQDIEDISGLTIEEIQKL